MKRKLLNNKIVNFLGEEPTYKKGGIKMFEKIQLKMKKVMKNEKGMTLIELLAVLVIIAIVALIAVPAIGNIINNSHDKALLSDASNIISGAKIAITDGACEETCTKAQLEDYVDVDNADYDSYTVTKNGSVYTINNFPFGNAKGTKYALSGNSATASAIAAKLKQ